MISADSIKVSHYGWIPNHLGEATKTEWIEKTIGPSATESDFDLIYELYEDEVRPSIAFSPVAEPGIIIAPVDECGMCLIGTSIGPGNRGTTDEKDLIPLVHEYWMYVCARLGDSFGQGFGFARMPIPIADEIDVYSGVADTFIRQTLENTLYLSNNTSFRMSLRYFQRDARFSTKLSFFERYLFIYRMQLGPWLPEYRSLAKHLDEINRAVEQRIEKKYRIRVDGSMVLFALATLLTTVLLSTASILR